MSRKLKPGDEDFESDLEHWSSPTGCHQDCPACAEERTPEQDEQREAEERLHRASPQLLAALKLCLRALTDETGWVKQREADACDAARSAIALTEPPKRKKRSNPSEPGHPDNPRSDYTINNQ